MYKKVDSLKSAVSMEKEIMEFWVEKNIIQKSFEQNEGNEYFTFYDGPPTANGKPHVGHVLTRVIKDLIPRYKIMKGYNVLRKAGWDTHGLPVELEIEKKLGISGKPDIEKYGVEEFIQQCKESVFSYVNMWEDMTKKVGFWVDMDHPYVTYHNEYIESVWWALKTIWNKGLLYKGHKILPYCPRCGTSLSSHEVAQGYKDVKEATAFVKFKVKNEDKYFLAWTTTPWTLPSNVALAVNKNYTYVEIVENGEHLILAKELLSILKSDYAIVKEFKGESLLGLEYEQLLPFFKTDKKAFYIVHGDYVTLSDGTGIVHIAPAYGEEDNLLGTKYNLPLVNLVDAEGKFLDTVNPWAGMFVKNADPEIIKYLKEQNKLYKSEKFTHSYPHCWRCDTPLLYYPKESWFIKMSSLKDKLLFNNNKINWYPDNIRTGRMGNFLENVIDWGISRDRYWGTPLPIWECDCGHKECIGSIDELKTKGINVPNDIELHKPYIDHIELQCDKCGKTMKRTSEVIDCWFDSGSMPFAQYHYPFENKELFESNFPAQFISEAVDQTRGWFYTLLAISTCVFDTKPFENCIVLGHVLDKNGLKMSKHKGNVVDPLTVLNNLGADATRWHFYTASAPWLPTRFSEKDVAESQRKFLGTLWNVYAFYVLYADLDQFNPTKYKNFISTNIMDEWIISKLNSLIMTVEKDLEEYKITQAALSIESFTDDLSNWYIRRNRNRFWGGELNDDKIGAYTTLYQVLVTLCKLAAPFVPFMTEEIYQNLVVNIDSNLKESIHLCTWPKYNLKLVNKILEDEMDLVIRIVKLGRNARNSVNIKNRQPLSKILISSNNLSSSYSEIIKDELNIKEIELSSDLSKYVNYQVKPNLIILGKHYGKLIPELIKEINMKNQTELANTIQNDKSVVIDVNGTLIELNIDNVLITMSGLDGFTFASEGSVGVVLDTHITDELREEGYIREIISKIQNIRKESNFAISDQIIIYLANNSYLEDIIKKHEHIIKNETLALKILYDYDESYDVYNINNNNLSIKLKNIN